ncbi:AzlD domain-containing protein [Vibrio hippocampi]|uniref:Branched-chain amino acid ABC transporter n=1 Tax=Vibrio hippocampi TaxID=654686 RepID=A0ABM8ZN49_9VIBR|nr:AzlD domain-containing protein [Vibrio hippocampi]CAH0529305.1 hypothetical protein VHP8226_03153 [Vibrio hippocampi]
MNTTLWIAMLVIAIATYLMRLLPIIWLRRRAQKKQHDTTNDTLPLWISVLGPAMIAAMFGTSLVPAHPSTSTWLATVIGVVTTSLCWYWKRSLGLPVLIGVLSFGLVVYLFP